MADDITSNATRLGIFVPSPKARINMGKPDLDAPFGYTGLSLQSDVHLLIDVNKVALYQSGSHSCWQVGGKWLQWSNSHMYMASTANNTVAADNKVTIAAGAGQGQITALDHGLAHVTPRVVDYNNLELHYRVEEVHNSLKTLFYGSTWKNVQNDSHASQEGFHDGGGYPAGGFLESFHTLLDGMGYDAAARRPLLQPLEWESDHVDLRLSDTSDYGPLKTFDPYAPSGFSGPRTKLFAQFVQTATFLHRVVDVLKKVGPAITDNFVGKRVQSLISAWGNGQDAINSAISVADIARFDRGTGEGGEHGAWKDEWGNVAARTPTSNPTTSSTAAKLTSVAGPFDISGVSSADLAITDTRGGTATTVSFSEFLTLEPARLVLTVAGTFTKIGVSAASTGTLTLDGAAVSFAQTTSATVPPITTSTWGALPAGFVWNPANTVVEKSDGTPFSAVAASGVTITDQTFASTDSIRVLVDGTNHMVSLSGINSLTAAGRAGALVTAIGAQSATATAAGAKVTIPSLALGPSGEVQVYGTTSVMTKLGMSGPALANGHSAGQVTAAQLAQKLAGHGTYTVSTSGENVSMKHTTTGPSSYLKASNEIATVFFGRNPAQSRGSEFFQRLSDLRSAQWEMAKWPEDMRNQTRPIYEAIGDVVAVWDRIEGVIENLKSAIMGGASPPKSIGLIAGDGITLGAKGAIYQTGESVTIVAATKQNGQGPLRDPDEDKFVPGLEALLKKVMDLGSNWEEDQRGKFKPTSAPGRASLKGFRVVSGENITMMASGDARIAALGTSRVEGTLVEATSLNGTTIASRTASLSLQGKDVMIGIHALAAAPPNQVLTENVHLLATKKILASTTGARVQIDEDAGVVAIKLGARLADAVDTTKPHVAIDVQGGKTFVGVSNGGEFGLTVPTDGKVTVVAKDELKLGVGGDAGIKIGGGAVALEAAQFKVGASLLVKSNGSFAPAAAVKLTTMSTKVAEIKPKYTAAILKATALHAKLVGLRASHAAGALALVNLPPGLMSLMSAYSLRSAQGRFEAQIEATRVQVTQHRLVWTALVQEARQAEVDDAIGMQDADAALFVID